MSLCKKMDDLDVKGWVKVQKPKAKAIDKDGDAQMDSSLQRDTKVDSKLGTTNSFMGKALGSDSFVMVPSASANLGNNSTGVQRSLLNQSESSKEARGVAEKRVINLYEIEITYNQCQLLIDFYNENGREAERVLTGQMLQLIRSCVGTPQYPVADSAAKLSRLIHAGSHSVRAAKDTLSRIKKWGEGRAKKQYTASRKVSHNMASVVETDTTVNAESEARAVTNRRLAKYLRSVPREPRNDGFGDTEEGIRIGLANPYTAASQPEDLVMALEQLNIRERRVCINCCGTYQASHQDIDKCGVEKCSHGLCLPCRITHGTITTPFRVGVITRVCLSCHRFRFKPQPIGIGCNCNVDTPCVFACYFCMPKYVGIPLAKQPNPMGTPNRFKRALEKIECVVRPAEFDRKRFAFYETLRRMAGSSAEVLKLMDVKRSDQLKIQAFQKFINQLCADNSKLWLIIFMYWDGFGFDDALQFQ